MPIKKTKKVTRKKQPLKLKKKPRKIGARNITGRKSKSLETKKAGRKINKLQRGIKERVVGIITHYFPKVRAAVVKLQSGLSVGDSIKIKGHTTDFTQKVDSLQIDRVSIKTARKGQEIGLLVNSRVRQADVVYKV